MEEINLKIPRIPDDPNPIELAVKNGNPLFIVGPNGSGKSVLIQQFVTENSRNSDKIKWITAHRQMWFDSGGTNFTPERRHQHEEQTLGYYLTNAARWKDLRSQEDLSAILFDLVAKENSRARATTRFVDNDKCAEARKISVESSSPFDQINELLDYGKLNVTVENSNDQDLLARRSRGEPFSIAEMSDGERSAMIIAAHVITAESETVFVIDEPERHLQRSIIQPFLSALFDLRREDCAFIIATHEIALPATNPEARVLMLRSCQWHGNQCVAWAADVLESNAELPEDLKLEILGSRQRILFVEGQLGSLDFSLYTALFPSISVIPKGSCEEVRRVVDGLRESHNFHYVRAFGIIDRDNLKDEEVEELAEKDIFALDVASVEALYYCSEAITTIACRQSESLEVDTNDLVTSMKQKTLDVLKNKGIAERLAARWCQRQIQELALSTIPNWESIKDNPNQPICVSIDPTPYSEELNRFKKYVEEENLDKLVARYPLRESRALHTIATSLGCHNRQVYERMVLARIRNDNQLACKLKERIGPLSETLESAENPQTE